MNELTAFQSFWIRVVNTLLHELGVPLPVMPTAFVLAARGTRGAGDLLLLIGAIVAGMLIGNSVWFAAGRRYGAGVLKFLCRFSLTADTCVSRTEECLDGGAGRRLSWAVSCPVFHWSRRHLPVRWG